MADLYPTKTRLALLRDVAAGRVYRSAGGKDMRRVRAGQNQIVVVAMRELGSAGWVELADDNRTWRLTDAGRTVLEEGDQ